MCAGYQSLSSFLATIITSPYSVAIFTVLVTIGINHIFQRRKEDIKALRAIRTEIENNEEIGVAQSGFIDESFTLDDPMDALHVYTRKFSTKSFDRAVETGVVWRLSKRERERLLQHYESVNEVNNALEHRRQMFFTKYSEVDASARERVESGSDDDLADVRINALSLKSMYPLLPQEFDSIDNLDIYLDLHGYSDHEDTLDDLDIDPSYIDFETMKTEIDNQIDSLNIIGIF